jgi:ATP-binding cassette subfamily B protein
MRAVLTALAPRRYASRSLPSAQTAVGLSRFFAAAARQVRPYWKAMTLVVVASVPQVALETVQPMLLMVLIDAIVGRNTQRVWLAVLGLIGLIPVYVAGNFLGEYMAARVAASVSNDLRIAAFWRLQALSVSYHRSRPRGDLLSRFSSDLDAVELAVATEFPLAVCKGRRSAAAAPSCSSPPSLVVRRSPCGASCPSAVWSP